MASIAPLAARPGRPIAWSVVGPSVASALLAFPTLVLAVRGTAGALIAPLPSEALALAGLAAMAVAAAGTRLAERNVVGRAAPQVALGFLVLALAVAVGRAWPALLLSVLALGEAAWALRVWAIQPRRDELVSPAAPSTAYARQAARIGDELTNDSDDVRASLRYERHASGKECVTGRVRVDFIPGQRTGRAHVAFCPPLGAAPRIELEQADGPEARVQVGQALAHGARFDVKLVDEAEEPASVWIEYVALCGSAPGGDEPTTDNEG